MARHPLFDPTGRRALVAGSSRGVSLAVARGLAEAGASVVLNGRDATRLAAAVASLVEAGLAVETSAFDATDATAVEDAVAGLESRLSPIDVLVNNGFIGCSAHTEPDLRSSLAARLDAVVLLTKAVGARMVRRGAGKVINLGLASGSSSDARGIAGWEALQGLTRELCAEWAPSGVLVNGIATTWTQQGGGRASQDGAVASCAPAGRGVRPEDLVGVAVFLAASASDRVNGQIVAVDDGLPTLA